MAKTTLARIKFGKKLKELRTQAGLSQEKLGFRQNYIELILALLKEANKMFPLTTSIN